MAQLTICGGKVGTDILEEMPVPEKYTKNRLSDPLPGNVGANYARLAQDIQTGSHNASNFSDGVGIQTLIAAIEESASTGKTIKVKATNRPLPM